MSKTDILEQEQNTVQSVIVFLHSIFARTVQLHANKLKMLLILGPCEEVSDVPLV